MIAPAAVVAVAMSWQGVKYHHQGRDRVSVDCIGFIGGVAADLGLPEAVQWNADQDSKGYGRDPDPVMLFRLCEKYLNRVSGTHREGDILVVIVPPHATPRHFAIVTCRSPLRIAHAYARGKRCVVETYFPPDMKIAAVYRYRGVG